MALYRCVKCGAPHSIAATAAAWSAAVWPMEKSTRSRKCSISARAPSISGRDGDDPAQPRGLRDQRRHFVDVRRPNRGAVLRASALAIDVRPFEMNADDLRAVGPIRRDAGDRLDRGVQIAARCRERRRRERGRSARRVKGEDALRGFVVRVHEVGAVAAVHVHVDEPGHEDARG